MLCACSFGEYKMLNLFRCQKLHANTLSHWARFGNYDRDQLREEPGDVVPTHLCARIVLRKRNPKPD